MTQAEIEQTLASPGPIALHTVLDRARDAGVENPRLIVVLHKGGLSVTLEAGDPKGTKLPIIFLDAKQVASGATWAPVFEQAYRAIRNWERAQKMGEASMSGLDSIVISNAELAMLPEYSCSLPTGVVLGKRWRRDSNFRHADAHEPAWMIGEYYDIGSQTEAGVRWSWAVIEPGLIHRGRLP